MGKKKISEFANKPTPTSSDLFLLQDGSTGIYYNVTESQLSAIFGVGSQSLSDTLTIGNIMINGQLIQSEDGLSTLQVNDNLLESKYDDGAGVTNQLTIDTVSSYIRATSGADYGLIQAKADKNTVTHTILNEFNATLNSIRADNGADYNRLLVNQSSIDLNSYNDNTSYSLNLELYSDNTTNYASLSSDSPTFQGLVYGSDYSANFVDRSLVDKGFVTTTLGSYELLSNKVTDLTSNDNTHYPTTQAVQTAINNSTIGLLDYRGSYDASTNLFPSSGGSGIAGAILKGDFWICSVAGTLGGTDITSGDLIIALVDTPAQTSSNWDLIEHSLNYVPENIANKSDSYTLSSSTTYASTKALVDGLATKQLTLSSGTNIKTVNGTTLLGSGNLAVGDALVANPLSQFASTTSAQLRSILSDENGNGSALFDNCVSANFITPVLGVAGATSLALSSFLNEAKSADIASASTTDLSTSTGNLIHITGTTTITSFGTLQAGSERVLVFNGALLITNSANIILPDSTNILTVANDVAVFKSEGSGVWRLINYLRNDNSYTTWSPSFTGYSANPTGVTARYSLNGKRCTVWINMTAGTSNATTTTVTLPFNASSSAVQIFSGILVQNGGTVGTNPGRVDTQVGSNIADVYLNNTKGSWATSGNKAFWISLTYEIA